MFNYCRPKIFINHIQICITLYRCLECLKKCNGCKAQGEMFKGKSEEWLFVPQGDTHNHLPFENQENN